MFVVFANALFDAFLGVDCLSMVAHSTLPLFRHVDGRLVFLAESVEGGHAALSDERLDLLGYKYVAELVEGIRDLVAGESKGEGVVDEKLIWLSEAELKLVLVQHLAVDLGSTLSHFGRVCAVIAMVMRTGEFGGAGGAGGG